MKLKTNWSLTATLVLGLLLAVVVSCSTSEPGSKGGLKRYRANSPEGLANSLLRNPNAEFANYHVSGRRDRATALDNIQQTAAGLPAARSSYGTAPGGVVRLDPQMLFAMNRLAREGYRFHVTSIAGSSHSRRSRHYLGTAFDINRINGVPVRAGSPYWREFIRKCKAMGATETLGPGDRGHSTHIHVAWPRPPGQ